MRPSQGMVSFSLMSNTPLALLHPPSRGNTPRVGQQKQRCVSGPPGLNAAFMRPGWVRSDWVTWSWSRWHTDTHTHSLTHTHTHKTHKWCSFFPDDDDKKQLWCRSDGAFRLVVFSNTLLRFVSFTCFHKTSIKLHFWGAASLRSVALLQQL